MAFYGLGVNNYRRSVYVDYTALKYHAMKQIATPGGILHLAGYIFFL